MGRADGSARLRRATPWQASRPYQRQEQNGSAGGFALPKMGRADEAWREDAGDRAPAYTAADYSYNRRAARHWTKSRGRGAWAEMRVPFTGCLKEIDAAWSICRGTRRKASTITAPVA